MGRRGRGAGCGQGEEGKDEGLWGGRMEGWKGGRVDGEMSGLEQEDVMDSETGSFFVLCVCACVCV